MENEPLQPKLLQHFRKNLKAIYAYIFSNSPLNADKFEKDLYDEVKKITQNPYPNPPQLDAKGEDSGFRYRTFKRNYKIIFKISPPFVKFVKLFHTKQNPDKMWD